MNQFATIEDLSVHEDKLLTAIEKKSLVGIIEDEFARQATLYNSRSEEQKEQLLTSYKKSIGYDLLAKELEKATQAVISAENKRDNIELKLKKKGINKDGERYTCSFYGTQTLEQKEIKKAVEKVGLLLKTAEEQAPHNIKNKIISRLWLAKTCGEATVILRQVLGNGIIPSLKINQLTQQ